MKQGIGTSHAKVILIGEHSVVYQQPAIAIPFKTCSCHVSILQSHTSTLRSELFEGQLSDVPSILNPIKHLIESLKTHLHSGDVTIDVTSNIPYSAGLGSSAALASAITQAFYDYAKLPLDDQTRFDWIQQSEKQAHGNPSGVDALTTSFDSAWWFIKGHQPTPITLSLPAHLIIAKSHESGSTKEAVLKVKGVIEREGDASIQALGMLAYQCLDAIHQHDIESLGHCMNQAHDHLSALGVSTPTLDKLVQVARSCGALGAKLTGGGLGGCIIALSRNQHDCDMIVSALKQHTPDVWSHNLQ